MATNDIILKSRTGVKKYPKTYTHNILDIDSYKPTGVEYKNASGEAQQNALKFVTCTQSEYDSMEIDMNTFYIITPISVNISMNLTSSSYATSIEVYDGNYSSGKKVYSKTSGFGSTLEITDLDITSGVMEIIFDSSSSAGLYIYNSGTTTGAVTFNEEYPGFGLSYNVAGDGAITGIEVDFDDD